MARSSNTILTKYKSSETVVTAEVANSWFGGLYGSSEGLAYDDNDPLVAGHIHDGVHQDGHAQKINLVNHVTGQLRNTNLADNAVIKRNIQSFTNQGSAIPEYEVILGTPHYYLDLSDIRSSIASNGAFITASGVTSNSPGDVTIDDFVFGSDTLNYTTVPHSSRMLFDKSKGAFRAGGATGTQWDNASRGFGSAAFGLNNIASAARCTVAGGESNGISAAGVYSFVGAGTTNAITNTESFIGAGDNNSVSAPYSFLGSGTNNDINSDSDYSVIVGGHYNVISDGGEANFIGAGGYNFGAAGNTIEASSGGSPGSCNAIVAGYSNKIDQNGLGSNFIGSGTGNEILGSGSNYNFIGSGISNVLTSSANSFVGSGRENEISAGLSVVCGGGGSGVGNSITSNVVTNPACFIGAGFENNITADDPTGSVISGGSANTISCKYGSISGGYNNLIDADSLYGVAMGADAAASSYGEIAISSGALTNGIRGSAQKSILIFKDELAGSTSDTSVTSLDGVSEYAIIQDNTLAYVTFSVVVTDASSSVYYAAKRCFLIKCDGAGSVTSLGSSSVTDEIDSGTESWSFQLGVASNSWNPRFVRDAGIPTTDRTIVCVAEITQVIDS